MIDGPEDDPYQGTKQQEQKRADGTEKFAHHGDRVQIDGNCSMVGAWSTVVGDWSESDAAAFAALALLSSASTRKCRAWVQTDNSIGLRPLSPTLMQR